MKILRSSSAFTYPILLHYLTHFLQQNYFRSTEIILCVISTTIHECWEQNTWFSWLKRDKKPGLAYKKQAKRSHAKFIWKTVVQFLPSHGLHL